MSKNVSAFPSTAIFTLAALAALGSCGRDPRLVIVSVSGLSSEVDWLRLWPTLAGQATLMPQVITDRSQMSRFGLDLPEHIQGSLTLRIEGISGPAQVNCVITEGSGSESVGGASYYEIAVALDTLQRRCTLSVTKGGPGTGTVTGDLPGGASDPPTFQCGTSCTGYATDGAQVMLSLVPDATSYGVNWSASGCAPGSESCGVTMHGPTTVSVTLAQKICTAAWCWENPLPQGNTLLGLWSAGDGVLWAVGAAGTVLRYDGHVWSNVPTGKSVALNDVWGSDAQHMWIAVDDGTILYRSNNGWTTQSVWNAPSGGEPPILGVWGNSATAQAGDVWAVGRSGSILQWSPSLAGAPWTQQQVPAAAQNQDLQAVWGSATDDIWAVGQGGMILHYTGSAGGWGVVAPPSAAIGQALYGIWGSGADDIWIAGAAGLLMHYDSSHTWTVVTPAPTSNDLYRVFGSGSGQVWVAGDGVVLGLANGQWQMQPLGSAVGQMLGGWAGANEPWAVGAAGAILSFDGKTWVNTTMGTTASLSAIWGRSQTDLWITGNNGLVLHGDGTSWLPEQGTGTASLRGLWGNSQELWVVGDLGTILRKGTDGVWSQDDKSSTITGGVNAVWGSGGEDVWAVGDGGLVAQLQTGSWQVVNSQGSDLYGLWGPGPGEVWAVGEAGAAVHCTAGTCMPEPVGGVAPPLLQGVIGFGGVLWAAGTGGIVLQRGLMGGWMMETSGVSSDLKGLQQNSWVERAERAA